LIQSILNHVPDTTIVVFGACDHELLGNLLHATDRRVVWLSPADDDSRAVDERIWQASKAGRLLFLIGAPQTLLPTLRSQLADQTVTLLFADGAGAAAETAQHAPTVVELVQSLTQRPAKIVLAVRRGDGAAARLDALRAALPGRTLAEPAPGADDRWLVATDAMDGAAAPPAAARRFDLSLVDENEHLIPRPYGTLQTLNLDHLHRYAFAKSFCYNADVLDAAMGCGYSSLLLNCRHYTGVDIDHNMVAFANEQYKPLIPNATYRQGSVLDLPVESGSIDTAISFETIEHLQPGDIGTYFAEMRRVLRPGGTFLCSTPLYRGDTYGVLTRYHPFEFRYGHFENVIAGSGFDLRSVWYQWPPYYTLQTVVPSFEQTQQAAPVIVVTVSQLR